VLLPLYLAIYWGVFGAFAARFSPSAHPRSSALKIAFCHAAVWAGLELLRGWLFTGFSWNGLGVAFHEMQTMAQGADLLGVTGLSWIVVFFQAMVVQAGRKLVGGESKARWDLGIAALLVLALFGYGKVRIGIEAKAESVRLKSLLVQLNIPQDAGQVLWTALETHMGYEDETQKALDAMKSADGKISSDWPDWVIWPECALTGRIFRTTDGEWGMPQNNHDTISRIRTMGPFSLIYGVNEQEAVKDGEHLIPKAKGRAYNSIAVMPPDDDLQTYRKRHLVIFGETIPFVDSIPSLKKIYEQQSGMEYGGSFTPGDSLEPLLIPAGQGTISAIPTVCFEDSVGRLTRKFVRPVPQVIVNVTNDGWFKQSAGAAQHFANARFRAIELRRPMLRCANTGVSAAVDSTGSTAHPDSGKSQILVDQTGSHFTRGSLLVELKIPLRPSFSLFAMIGDWGMIFMAVSGFLIAMLSAQRRTEPTAVTIESR
jgi:apolipoprotein N-acyltransferase